MGESRTLLIAGKASKKELPQNEFFIQDTVPPI